MKLRNPCKHPRPGDVLTKRTHGGVRVTVRVVVEVRGCYDQPSRVKYVSVPGNARVRECNLKTWQDWSPGAEVKNIA